MGETARRNIATRLRTAKKGLYSLLYVWTSLTDVFVPLAQYWTKGSSQAKQMQRCALSQPVANEVRCMPYTALSVHLASQGSLFASWLYIMSIYPREKGRECGGKGVKQAPWFGPSLSQTPSGEGLPAGPEGV